jgi:hypothetical protein
MRCFLSPYRSELHLRRVGKKGKAISGNLTMSHLAVGIILFTAVMSFDILTFGLNIRKECNKKAFILENLFALPGRIVLAAIWLLISVGWLLVVRFRATNGRLTLWKWRFGN